MNDIKRTTGHLMPQSFVHIECTKGANDEDIFTDVHAISTI